MGKAIDRLLSLSEVHAHKRVSRTGKVISVPAYSRHADLKSTVKGLLAQRGDDSRQSLTRALDHLDKAEKSRDSDDNMASFHYGQASIALENAHRVIGGALDPAFKGVSRDADALDKEHFKRSKKLQPALHKSPRKPPPNWMTPDH